jgi:hypothetical protein
MSTEESKSVVELAMFRKFVCVSGLPVVAGSERKGSALLREPDILCELSGEPAGFELAEACAPEFAAAASAAPRSAEGVTFAWGDDVSAATLRQKLAKRYAVACPEPPLLSRTPMSGDNPRSEVSNGEASAVLR